MLMYVPTVSGFLPEINVFVLVLSTNLGGVTGRQAGIETSLDVSNACGPVVAKPSVNEHSKQVTGTLRGAEGGRHDGQEVSLLFRVPVQALLTIAGHTTTVLGRGQQPSTIDTCGGDHMITCYMSVILHVSVCMY